MFSNRDKFDNDYRATDATREQTMTEKIVHSFTEDVYYIDARMRCACGWASFGFLRYWKAGRHVKQVRRMEKLTAFIG